MVHLFYSRDPLTPHLTPCAYHLALQFFRKIVRHRRKAVGLLQRNRFPVICGLDRIVFGAVVQIGIFIERIHYVVAVAGGLEHQLRFS